MDTAELAHRIVEGFLVPAVEATEYHERWKSVNRAAGVIACYGAANGRQAAERLATEAAGGLASFRPWTSAEAANVMMILGPNGLPKRLAECVAALSD